MALSETYFLIKKATGGGLLIKYTLTVRPYLLNCQPLHLEAPKLIPGEEPWLVSTKPGWKTSANTETFSQPAQLQHYTLSSLAVGHQDMQFVGLIRTTVVRKDQSVVTYTQLHFCGHNSMLLSPSIPLFHVGRRHPCSTSNPKLPLRTTPPNTSRWEAPDLCLVFVSARWAFSVHDLRQ